jgi:hypothetical protein
LLFLYTQFPLNGEAEPPNACRAPPEIAIRAIAELFASLNQSVGSMVIWENDASEVAGYCWRDAAQRQTNHSILHLKQPLLASTPIVGAQDCKQGGDVSTESKNTSSILVKRHQLLSECLSQQLFIDKGLAVRYLPSRNDVMAVRS